MCAAACLSLLPRSCCRHNFPGVTLLLYNTPTATGTSRIIMSFVAPPGTHATRQLPGWLNVILNGIDRVPALQHALNRNAIIDGDTYFLHVAERELYERGGSASWPQNYYLPGSSDAAVVSLRKWIDTHGSTLPTARPAAAGGAGAGEGALPTLLPREVVLDRLSQHTKHCPHCTAALRAATIGAALCAALAAVAAGAVVAAVVGGIAPLASPFCAAAAGVAALAGAVAVLLMRARNLYIYTDWIHADH
jgi:hypothetical protein